MERRDDLRFQLKTSPIDAFDQVQTILFLGGRIWAIGIYGWETFSADFGIVTVYRVSLNLLIFFLCFAYRTALVEQVTRERKEKKGIKYVRFDENEADTAGVANPTPTFQHTSVLRKIEGGQDHGLGMRHRVSTLLVA